MHMTEKRTMSRVGMFVYVDQSSSGHRQSVLDNSVGQSDFLGSLMLSNLIEYKINNTKAKILTPSFPQKKME